VIVSCKQRLRSVVRRVVQVLGNGPRDRQAIERRGAAPDLVKQHERARRGAVQDGRGLSNIDQERRTAARQIV
jgi:hypothetical protein